MNVKHLFFTTLLFLTACGETIRVGAPPPPQEWLSCAPEPARNSLPGLTPIPLPNGITGYNKGQVDRRDSAIAGYILDLRAAHFDCEMQLGKVRTYHEAAE
jgi:hypothetical protein